MEVSKIITKFASVLENNKTILRIMEKQNAKRIESRRLLESIIQVEMDEVKYEYDDTEGHIRKNSFSICVINSCRYIKIGVPNWLTKLERNGLTEFGDVFRVRTNITLYNGTVSHFPNRTQVIIKLDLFLKHYEYDAKREEERGWRYLAAEIRNLAEVAKSFNQITKCYTFSEEELRASEEAYRKSKQLTLEANREEEEERVVKSLKALEEEEKRERQQEKTREETLKELVAKIEAMGWEVTLKLKND